jgi:hypothetical protein
MASEEHNNRVALMKIKEYKTAVGGDVPELDKDVNKLIKEGVQPYGQP